MPKPLDRRLANRAHNARRRSDSPVQLWYRSERWKRLRAAQLAGEPRCRMCLAEGRVTPATICDHVTPHRGNAVRFWSGPFQSLCKPCHDGPKQRDEALGLRDPGPTGWDE